MGPRRRPKTASSTFCDFSSFFATASLASLASLAPTFTENCCRYRRVPVPPAALANALCFPSYLSGHWALSFDGLIPEAVAVYTSVTTRGPISFDNEYGMFRYSAIKRSLFFGYRSVTIAGSEALVATAEKALLDLFHLHHGEWDRSRMIEMRFQQTEVVDRNRLRAYAQRIGKPRVLRAVDVWLACSAEQDAGVERTRPDAGRRPVPGGRLVHPADGAPCRPGHARTGP